MGSSEGGRSVDVGDGLEVHYHERGSGPPVVFVHGGGHGSSGISNWRGSLDHFAREGYRAIAPDVLGFGFSSKPADATYDDELMVGGLRRFLDRLGIDRTVLVGNSMGGALSLKLALDDPGRVEKVVVMAPAGIGDPARYMAMPGLQLLFRLARDPDGTKPEKLRQMFEILCHDKRFVTDELVAERAKVARTQPPAVFQTLRIADLAPRLPDLAMPLLVLWGRDDQFCPVDIGLEMVKACRRSRLVVFSECGHWVQAERADVFNRMCVDFLRER